jgi:hypothetical protein
MKDTFIIRFPIYARRYQKRDSRNFWVSPSRQRGMKMNVMALGVI